MQNEEEGSAAATAHEMPNRMAFDARGKLPTQFTFVSRVEPFSQKHGDLVGLDGVGKGADQFLVNGGEAFTVFEDYVGCVLGLHDAPMHA